nr:unnamed protein product [Callosobruchus analis]
MNVDKLITCVQENRCLWDMMDKSYHNREMCRRGWETVAAELNTSSEIAKTKWRGLRDTFRKELSKNPKKRSGDEGGIIKESKWAYFKSMEFLKDQFQKRHLQGNVPRSIVPSSDDEDSFSPSVEDEQESQTETLVPPQDTRDETPPPQTLHANFAVPQKKLARSVTLMSLDN